MKADRKTPDAAHSVRSHAAEGSISRRDTLTLAAAGLAAPLLPTTSFAQSRTETNPMSYIKVGQENSQPIELYYEDHGLGSPVVLIHGWPLNGDAWEKQTAALIAAGHRVITYDRRGFGRSSKPGIGYNYDTFAADLEALAARTESGSASKSWMPIGQSPLALRPSAPFLRRFLSRNDVPTMIIHGDDDRILPADVTARRQARMLKDVKYMEIKGASHGLTWTRAEEINAQLVPFLA